MADVTFAAAVWKHWTGRELTESAARLVEACLVYSMDHGSEPPSAFVAEIVGSCHKPVADAVAAGLLTLGPRHGNACGAACRVFQSSLPNQPAKDLVARVLTERQRLPGYGHAIYKDVDPRAVALTKLALASLPESSHVRFALEIERELATQKGKPLPLNIDGAIGAIVADVGGEAVHADALFTCARAFGLVKHAVGGAARDTYIRGQQSI